MKKQIITASLIIAASAALFSACHKPETTTPEVIAKGMLKFHIHTNIDSTEVEAGDVATDEWGRRYQLDVAQLYISGITLRKADGSKYTVSNVNILKTMAAEEYYIDSVPAGNYVGVEFRVGLDATTNATDPASYAATSVLAMQSPTMWFGNTTQGYIFVNIQGKVDTSAAHNATPNVDFSYQLGTNALARTVVMPDKAFSVVANQVAFVHLTADFSEALKWVPLDSVTHATPFTNDSLMTNMADNVPSMFSYEE